MSKMKTWAAAAVAAVASVTGASAFADGEVAQIGATKYASLSAAFEAATPGDTVTMLCDYELPSALTVPVSLTLNLAGYRLDGKNVADWVFTVTNGSGVASLVISNGSYRAESAQVKGFASIVCAGTVVRFADLDLNDTGCHRLLNFDNGVTGTVVNCKITGPRPNTGLFIGSDSEVTIEDSTIDVDNIAAVTQPNYHYIASAIGLSGPGAAQPYERRPRLFVRGNSIVKGGMYGVYLMAGGGEATLESGTYGYYNETNLTAGTGKVKSAPIFADHINPNSGVGHTNIFYVTGGTYNGRIAISDRNAAIYLKDGTFNDFSVHGISDRNISPVIISGGSFDADPNPWVVEGKVAKKTEATGRWDNFVDAVRFTVEPAEHSSFVAWKNETYGYTNSTNVAEFEAKQYLSKIAVGDKYEVTFAADDGYLFEDDTLTNALNGVAGDADFEVSGPATKEADDPTTKSVEAAKAGDAIVLPSGKQLSDVEILNDGKEMKIGDDSWTKENYVFVKGTEAVTVEIDPEKKMVASFSIKDGKVTITTPATVSAFWYAVTHADNVQFAESATTDYQAGTGSAQTIELSTDGAQRFYQLSVVDRDPSAE